MLVKDLAREGAQQVLRDHWDGELPVNPVEIARALKINVSFGELAGLAGVILHRQGDTRIVISEKDDLPRQLFTCAHELGHYWERKSNEDDEYSFSEPKDERAAAELRGGEWSLHEFYADEFAGNLLMPEREFVRWYKADRSVGTLAEVFGVSRAAVRSRLRRLRVDGKLPAA